MAAYTWHEIPAGLIITWTELKKDGITATGAKENWLRVTPSSTARMEALLHDKYETLYA